MRFSAYRPTILSTCVAISHLWTVCAKAPSGPWDAFNLSPSSRVVRPVAIHSSQGSIKNAENLFSDSGLATFTGNETSWIALDFGKEVGGLISMGISLPPSFSTPSQDLPIPLPLSLAFTESPLFISPLKSDDSSTSATNQSYDGVEPVALTTLEFNGRWYVWTQPASRLRGGFRYLTIVAQNFTDALNATPTGFGLTDVTCTLSFMPHIPDDELRSYAGYFIASDPVFHDKDFLTKVWYAGAYTLQTNIVGVDTGREVPFVRSPDWQNNATLGIAGPVIVDGAKRDRAIWPGDMGIALATSFLTIPPSITSSNSSSSPIRNALATLFTKINPTTGALPESGPPLSQTGSDTYHMWTLIGVYEYYLWSGDAEFVQEIWGNYTKAVEFVRNKITPLGLMNVTGLRDWGRLGQGGINAEANAILYRTLLTASDLTSLFSPNNDTSTSTSLTTTDLRSLAQTLKQSFTSTFYDPTRGLFRDNDTSTTVYPQDANALALLFNLTVSEEQAGNVSGGLVGNWGTFGAVTPELEGTVSPFVSGFEVQAHFTSGNDNRAMELMRREWGYMLYTNISVQSTLLEGFNADGSLGYRATDGYSNDPTYTSHSHGWSTGPTSALTTYVLGLKLILPSNLNSNSNSNPKSNLNLYSNFMTTPAEYRAGQFWSVSPHLAGLGGAEGGFETGLGWFGVKWSVANGTMGGRNSGVVFKMSVSTPSGTRGAIRIPELGSSLEGGVGSGGKARVGAGVSVQLDGRDVVPERVWGERGQEVLVLGVEGGGTKELVVVSSAQ